MCGIVGILSNNRNHIENIQELLDTLLHRGPDGNGLFIDNNLALGHTRLSIIDLKTGHQPMESYDNNYVIIFNGEIYNYLDIKDELLKKNHIFILLHINQRLTRTLYIYIKIDSAIQILREQCI